MKVQAVVIRHREDGPPNPIFPVSGRVRKGDVFEVRARVPAACCQEMEEAWGNRVVGFGDYETMCNRDTSVNIYDWHIYPEGSFADSRPVRFCPFCGEQIEVELTEETVQSQQDGSGTPAEPQP